MASLLKWKVDPKPTGSYSSFQARAWPIGYFRDNDGGPTENGSCAVQIVSTAPGLAGSYEPRNVNNGDYPPLNVMVADHSSEQWKWKYLMAGGAKIQFKTLAEAKARAEAFLNNHPEMWPATLRPEKTA